MLTSPNQQLGFLPIARRILTDDTYSKLCRDHHRFRPRSWKILERWSLNRPERVLLMEPYAFLLSMRIEEQAKIEDEALDKEASLLLLAQGWTDEEVLKQMGVETDLLRLALLSDPVPGRLPTFTN